MRHRSLRIAFALLALTLVLAPTIGAIAAPEDARSPLLTTLSLPSQQALSGVVRPSKQVTLNAPVDAILMEVKVAEGDRVKTGDVLAQMDSRLAELRLAAVRLTAQATAEADSAKALMDESQRNLGQTKSAFDKGAATSWELQRAELDYLRRQADHEQVLEGRAINQQRLKMEEQVLAQYTLRAPFDGLVLRVETQAGSTLTPRDAILKLVNLDPLEAVVDVSAKYYGQLKVGQKYTLAGAAPVHRKFEGALKVADPVIEAASQSFRCVFTIANPDLSMPAGFSVQLELPEPAPAAAQ